MNTYYAGVGSRTTPSAVLAGLTRIAARLADRGFTLRSGAADGADVAFEKGAVQKEIFLPWKNFNGSKDGVVVPLSAESVALARKFHPAYDRLSPAARRLMIRNGHQVLGADLKSPVAFLLCWTPGGRGEGGTGQAIRIARAHGVPVFDLGLGCRKVLNALALYLELMKVAKIA